MDTPTVPSAPGPWSRRRRLTLGFTALALVAGGGAAIAAGNPDTDTTDPGSVTAAAKPVPGKAAFALGGVLHSESVMSDGDGGYVTHLTQIGKIESIDSDRLTVVSEDGYERSWSRTSDTVVGGGGWSVSENDDGSYTVKKDTDELSEGDQVLVVGTLTDDVATAQRIAARPDAGEIPGMIMKRFEGEFGEHREGMPMLKDRLMKRFEGGGDKLIVPGPMGGPGEDVRRFEFPMPGGAGVPSEKAVPGEKPAPSEQSEPSEAGVPSEASAPEA